MPKTHAMSSVLNCNLRFQLPRRQVENVSMPSEVSLAPKTVTSSNTTAGRVTLAASTRENAIING